MKLKTEFQDEDFKLGEVADVNIATMPDGRIKAQAVAKSGGVHTFFYDDLKTFTDDWEDAPEEPKEYWFIRDHTSSVGYAPSYNATAKYRKEVVGNYFETKEEAEKAVEKLKAWKRVKDKGFRFDGWDGNHHNLGIIEFSFDKVENNFQVWDFEKDLDLLFGGEK